MATAFVLDSLNPLHDLALDMPTPQLSRSSSIDSISSTESMSSAIPLKSAFKRSDRLGAHISNAPRRFVAFRKQHEVCFYDEEEQPNACHRYIRSNAAGRDPDTVRFLAQIIRHRDVGIQQSQLIGSINRNISMEPARFKEQPVHFRTARQKRLHRITGDHSPASTATLRRVARLEHQERERIVNDRVYRLHFSHLLSTPGNNDFTPVSTSQASPIAIAPRSSAASPLQNPTSARESKSGLVDELNATHLLKAIHMLDACSRGCIDGLDLDE